MNVKLFAVIVLFLFSSIAAAQEVKQISVRGIGTTPYQELFKESSEIGEDIDSFAKRIAPKFRAYSDENGFEACGVITTDGEKFSVVVGTNFGYMVCINSTDFAEAGFKHAGATIHSHGKQGRFKPSKTDLLFMSQNFAGQRASLVVVHGQALNAFSNEDVKSGPGYLAGEDGKLFFQGNGTFREIQ